MKHLSFLKYTCLISLWFSLWLFTSYESAPVKSIHPPQELTLKVGKWITFDRDPGKSECNPELKTYHVTKREDNGKFDETEINFYA